VVGTGKAGGLSEYVKSAALFTVALLVVFAVGVAVGVRLHTDFVAIDKRGMDMYHDGLRDGARAAKEACK